MDIYKGINYFNNLYKDQDYPESNYSSRSKYLIQTTMDYIQYYIVSGKTTTCISLTCYPVVRYNITRTTISITSTTIDSCPVIITGQPYIIDIDIFSGYNACAWPVVPIAINGPDIGEDFNDLNINTNDNILEWPFNKRDAGLAYGAIQKRAKPKPVVILKAGFCDINTCII